AEDRRGEVAAVSAQRRLQTVCRSRDETRDDKRRVDLTRNDLSRVRARFIPPHARTKCAPGPSHVVARVDPHHSARSAAPRGEIAGKQTRGPDFAKPGD